MPRALEPVARRLAAALLLVVGAGCGGQASDASGSEGTAADAPSGGARQRLVLVTLDTLRLDALEQGMPRLAARAEAGALSFSRFYTSSPSTQPSHASKLTGLHPWQHGVTRNGQVLGEGVETVAETLQDAGWATGAVVASYPLDPRFGQAQGFDHVAAEFTEERRAKVRQWKGHEPDWDAFYALAPTVTEQALPLLDELDRFERSFLWLHYYDPHSPYGDGAGMPNRLETKLLTALAQMDDPEQLDDAIRRARNKYLADCKALDRSLDLVLARLLDDDDGVETHVVITADHGESFGDDDSFGHGDRVTAPQVHVPLLVFSPKVEPGVRDDVAGSVDVHATLLSLAGVRGPSGTAGRDLLASPPADGGAAFGMRRSLAGAASDVRRDGTIIKLSGNTYFAVRDGVHWYGDGESVAAYAGDATGDEAGRVSRAFAAFERALSGVEVEEDLSAEAQQALEALGYTR